MDKLKGNGRTARVDHNGHLTINITLSEEELVNIRRSKSGFLQLHLVNDGSVDKFGNDFKLCNGHVFIQAAKATEVDTRKKGSEIIWDEPQPAGCDNKGRSTLDWR